MKIGSKRRDYKNSISNNLSSEIVFEAFQHLTSALILKKQRRHVVFIKSIDMNTILLYRQNVNHLNRTYLRSTRRQNKTG